jgi:hypothetical protein
MTKGTWGILGNPIVVPSLGRKGLFKGKMVTLCGIVTNVPIIVHGASTGEEIEVIKFVENNAPFPLFLGLRGIRSEEKQRKRP